MSIVVANSPNTDPTNIDAALRHLTADELELYSLGMVKDNGQLARLEEHLLVCEYCVDRATQMDDWVTAMKSALRAEPQGMEDGGPEEPS